jgi:hypothetical protein
LQFCKNLGLYLQKRMANIMRMDLIHRIKIRRPGFNAGEGVRVDRYASLTGTVGSHPGRWLGNRRPRSCASGCGGARPEAAQRRGGARRRLAGAQRHRCRGAPKAAGTAPGRLARTREDDGELQGRQGRLDAADGGRARRRRSGEAVRATRCTSVQTKSTSVLLTSTRGSRSASRRRKNDGGEKSSGGRLGFCATAAEGGAARVAARRACAIGRRGGL